MQLDKRPILTFTELESTTCFRTTRLLTFNNAGITCHEPFCAKCLLVVCIDFHQCAGDCKTQRLRLAGKTTAVYIHLDVIFFFYTQSRQRLLYHILKNCRGKVLCKVSLVNSNLSCTLANIYASYGALTSA